MMISKYIQFQHYFFMLYQIYYHNSFLSNKYRSMGSSNSSSENQKKAKANLLPNPQQPKPKSVPKPTIAINYSSVPPVNNPTNLSKVNVNQDHSGQKIKVKVKLINNETHEVSVAKQMTGYQLKTMISTTISDSLTQHQMNLYYMGTQITNKTILSSLNIVIGTQITVEQGKLALNQVANIVADMDDIDPISYEQGTAKMACGHSIGRDTMTQLIRSLISSKSYEIRCPLNDENQNRCNHPWNFRICKKIGQFTKEETLEFEEGLSMNWIKQFTKDCPYCSFNVCKADLTTSRVKCSKCNSPDFCYRCLGKWKGNDDKFCGNQQCAEIGEFLSNCLWNRVFSLKDTHNNDSVLNVNTPQYRACPTCFTIIENYISCKHTKCKSCLKQFCWVCLQIRTTEGWKCGSYNHYCGKVAQAQKLNK